jgi:predicted ester cyclase
MTGRGRVLQAALASLVLGAAACTAGAFPRSATPPSQRPQYADRTAAEERRANAVRRYFDEVWSQGRLEVLDELLAPNYVNHTPSTPNPPPGPDGLKPIVSAFREAFPDLRFTVEEMLVEGDQVAARVRMEGTHEGPLFGIPATHARVNVVQINLERFQGDQIVEHWRVTDELKLMRQLGVVPRPPEIALSSARTRGSGR